MRTKIDFYEELRKRQANPVCRMAWRNASAGDGWNYPDDGVAIEAAVDGEDDFSAAAREAAKDILFWGKEAPATATCAACGRVHLLTEAGTHCGRCSQVAG